MEDFKDAMSADFLYVYEIGNVFALLQHRIMWY